MSDIIYVIYWTHGRFRGEHHERGNDAERRVLNMIASGEFHYIEKVERYEAEDPDNTEDIAIALANLLGTYETVRPDLFDFIETHAGLKYTAGLRRSEMTFTAE
jgi:hypothetical protein